MPAFCFLSEQPRLQIRAGGKTIVSIPDHACRTRKPPVIHTIVGEHKRDAHDELALSQLAGEAFVAAYLNHSTLSAPGGPIYGVRMSGPRIFFVRFDFTPAYFNNVLAEATQPAAVLAHVWGGDAVSNSRANRGLQGTRWGYNLAFPEERKEAFRMLASLLLSSARLSAPSVIV